MSKSINLDLEDVYYLLNLLPAMKDINDPARYMKIIADIHDQSLEPVEELQEGLHAPDWMSKNGIQDEMNFTGGTDPLYKLFVEKYKGNSLAAGGIVSTSGKPVGMLGASYANGLNAELKLPHQDPWVVPNYFYFPMEQLFTPDHNGYSLKIKAIKLVRDVTGLGLKDAKHAVEIGTKFHFDPKIWDKAKLQKMAEEAGLEIEFS